MTFLIWPFGVFIGSFRFIGQRIFSLILVLFYFLYGYTYIISGKDQDNYRVSQYFEESSKLTFSDLSNKILNLYELGNKPDFFQDLLQFLVSRFTNNVQVYFAVSAVIFAIISGLIFERSLSKKLANGKSNIFVLLAAIFLLLILSPGRINSFRHYFALAIFLFSMYSYNQTGKLKYVLLLCITPFIHFAFIMVIPLIVVFKIIGNRFWVYYLLIFASFIFTDQASNYIRDYTAGLDENALQYHATQYTSDLYLKRVDEVKLQRNYFLDKYTFFTSLAFLVIIIYHSSYVKGASKEIKNLYSFSLLLFSLINFFGNLESIANRFGLLYQGFCCLFLIRFYLTNEVRASYVLKVFFTIILLVNAVVIIRITMQSASLSTILLFFPVSIVSPVEVSILEWLK